MRTTPRLRARLRRWRALTRRALLRLAPTEAQRLFLLTILVGAAAGLAAVGFHLAVLLAESQLISRALAAPGLSWVAWSILTPAAGGLAAGVALQFVFPNARGSGIPQVKVAYASRDGVVPLRDAVGKFLLGSLQIGSGASLGREGPTVQICAGIASALGRVAQVSPQSQRRLIPVGAAAGIAAIFNAPIAAVTFAIEEVVGKLDQTLLSGVIVAAAVAAAIERSFLGGHPVLDAHASYGLGDARSLALYAALGVAAALVSVVLTDGFLSVRRRFREMRRIPPWAQPAIGGAATGAIAVAVMAWLGTGGVTGGGYEVLRQSLSGNLAVGVMLVLCAAKIAATVLSYSSGGAGGIFAPTLFIGAMLGGAFGSLDRALFHHADEALGAFALVGMGAVFSGTIRAPMTGVLIIVEMTSGYGLILPLMIANMSAWILARRWRREPIYEALLSQDGIHLRDRGILDALEELKLDAHVRRGAAAVSFGPGTPGSELARCADGEGQAVFPVLDAAGKVVGLVVREDLALLRTEPGLQAVVNASDLMRPPVGIRIEEDLRSAFELMRAEGLDEVPVIDEAGRIEGFIDEATIARAYLRVGEPRSAKRG